MSQATLLLVDDDVTTLARLSEQLGAAGYQLVKASEVAHAELLFAEQRPALVLLEVDIEHGAGWQLLQRLSADTQVIVVSLHGREEDVVRGFDYGAADYVAKPFRSAELLARVRLRLANAPHATVGTTTHLQPTDLPAPPALAPVQPQRPDNTPARASGRRMLGEADAEPVFITHADERQLLAGSAVGHPEDQQPDDNISLGRRLYLARQRRRINLVQAESELNIRMYYLQAMEEEKFMLLPTGVVAENFLLKYAQFLGLEPNRVREEYREEHRRPSAVPPPNLGGAPARGVPRWLVWLLAVLLAITVCVGAIVWLDPQGANALAENIRNLLP